MRHVDRRKVKGVIVIRGISRNEMLREAYRSSLHIVRYRGQPRVQNDKGFPPEQLHEFRRYPSFDSALAFTVDARPTGRCTVAAPADEDFHVQPPFVRKALSWKAGTRKYARKDFTGAGYCLGVHAKSMSLPEAYYRTGFQKYKSPSRKQLIETFLPAERVSAISIACLAVQGLDYTGR